MTEGRPPDVRDSLSELEQRLLELERELRADATSDASIARQRIPVPRPPYGGEPPREPAPSARPAAASAATVERPRRESGGPAVPQVPASPDPADPGLAPLVYETQRRVDALRDTLDGLSGASDRLREVAQVVVEDHGRALVRLERATAQGRAQQAAAPEAEIAEPLAPGRGAAVAVPEPAEVIAPEPGDVAPASEPEAIAAEAGRAARRRRRLIWWIAAPLLVAAGLATALLVFGGEDEAPGPSSLPGSGARIALDTGLGRDAAAFASIPGRRQASDIGAEADLCDGVVGAAVVLRSAAEETIPRCSGLVTIADGTVSARAIGERGGTGKRRCINADQASSLAATRADTRRTSARQLAVRRGISRAQRETRSAGLTASERVGTLAQAAYDAGRRFDQRARLRLYAVRKRTGTKCVVPGRDDVAAGRYPLSQRVELLTRASNAKLPVVQRAAVAIDNITSRPAPIDVTVLRRAR